MYRGYFCKSIFIFMKNYKNYISLAVAAGVAGILAALLAIILKRMTEYFEEALFEKASQNTFLFILLPAVGLSLIFLLRYYLFRNKENKGIKEVLDSKASGKKLPSYKIPSHFINGLLTVGFGGSTGIEVSTVVSAAAVGSLVTEKHSFLKRFRTELICAGIAAGVTALFASPLAGLFFAYEVIYKRVGKTFAYAVLPAVAVAWAFLLLLDEKPVFNLPITHWNAYALPWFALLGVLCGLNGVYLTRCVLYIKQRFAQLLSVRLRIAAAALSIGIMILLLPQLYGDGYHALKHAFAGANTAVLSPVIFVTLAGVIILKPIITSITLSGGGDGGVFAPGIFIGAFLGLLTALILNTCFNAGVVPLNFMAAGMAAVLSASIHAPLTALFLTCSIAGNYTLFVPVLIVCVIAKYTARAIYPYNVYTYPAVAYANKKN